MFNIFKKMSGSGAGQRVFHSYTSHKESHTITVQPWAVNTIAFVTGREV